MSFFNLSKKSPNSLKPITRKPRHRCPFYGFHYSGFQKVFMDSEGNQCAIIMQAYAPCKMEFRGQTPDWDKCPFNNWRNREILESIKDSAMVFPKELWPKGEKKWDGIPLDEWMEYVMGDEAPRPEQKEV